MTACLTLNEILLVEDDILIMRVPKLDAVRFLPLPAWESLHKVLDRIPRFPAILRNDPLPRSEKILTQSVSTRIPQVAISGRIGLVTDGCQEVEDDARKLLSIRIVEVT